MANSGIQVPEGLMKHIHDRNNLWDTIDNVKSQESKFRGLSSRVELQLGSINGIGFLSDDKTAPSELHNTLNKLEVELKEIDTLQERIKGGQAEIKTINARYRNFIIGMILVGTIFAIVILVFVIMTITAFM